MTVKSKKRKLKRARAHAKRIDNRGSVSTRSIRKARLSVVVQDMIDDVTSATGGPFKRSIPGPVETPTRAKCPSCGFSHKVRKDGTMSRHDVFIGSDPQQCEGTGKQWDA